VAVRGLTLFAEVLTLESVLRWRDTNLLEGFLSLRMRGLLFAAMMGLAAGVCLGQDAAAPNQAPAAQTSPAQAAPNQASQEPPSQAPAAPEQAPAAQAPTTQGPKDPVPVSKTPQKPAAPPAPQLNQSAISLDSSETIFSFLTALNACGYDQDLTISDATRSNVRAEVERVLQASADAEAARTAVCEFVQKHMAGRDANRNLSQYISLAFYVDGPPHFVPRGAKDDELPPDASGITAFGALMERFYDKVGLHSIWERHRNEYGAAMRRYHEPLAKMVFDTEVYLKEPSSQYLGRRFTVYLDFMGSPNETDARNYGREYYVVVFPAPNAGSRDGGPSGLKMEQIRHTFLHYEMDPLAEKHYSSIKRLEPLLGSVKRAPIEEAFKTDISLLVTECLVRAIEIRTSGNKQTAEAMRTQAVDDAVKQGYILTRYFYDAVTGFEKDPAGIRGAYSDFLNNVDLKKEEKAAAEVQFASTTSPELVRLSRPEDRRMLLTAEKRLAAGDPKGAQELAQAALDKKIGDQGRALFILAEVAVANKNRDGAQENFEKAIAASQDPTVLGWSHVYLGRILDMKEDREAALVEYKAALTEGQKLPEIKAAAEHGIEHSYEPPAKPQAADQGKKEH
jgi:tetratricopeptide (TPR) repeat protein